MFKNKKGQFYIIISVILAIAVFSVTSNPNTIKEAVLFEDFEDVSNNYIHESEYVINNALQNEDNININLAVFTNRYLQYSEQRNPNLQLLYVYSNGSDVYLANYFNGAVINDKTETLGAGQPLMQDVFINIAGKEFTHKVPVKTQEFGKDWYTGSMPNAFNLSIAGFVHNFNLTQSGPDFKVIINLPGEILEIPFGEGTDEYEFGRASPPQNDTIKNLIRQVNIR